jgi:hypothetical protein
LIGTRTGPGLYGCEAQRADNDRANAYDLHKLFPLSISLFGRLKKVKANQGVFVKRHEDLSKIESSLGRGYLRTFFENFSERSAHPIATIPDGRSGPPTGHRPHASFIQPSREVIVPRRSPPHAKPRRAGRGWAGRGNPATEQAWASSNQNLLCPGTEPTNPGRWIQSSQIGLTLISQTFTKLMESLRISLESGGDNVRLL